MSIPIAFVVGLLVLLTARVEAVVLPGSGSVWHVLATAPALLVPALLAHAAERLAIQHAIRSGSPVAPARARVLFRLAAGLAPLVQLVVLVPGTWLDLAVTLAGGSQTVQTLLLIAPLTLGEIARILAETRAQRRFEGIEILAGPLARHRIAFVAIVTAPWLLLSLSVDLLASDRWLYVHAMVTSIGTTIGGILFLVAIGVLLPLAFRALFGFSRALPAAIADELRRTAAALGFPGRAVLRFDSGMRMVNALMLGPLPWPRYLVLTDGLLATLDVHALRGVVAHEVGHAQAGHPLLLMALFVVVPLLLGNLLLHVDFAAVDVVWLALAVVVAGLAIVQLLRRIAHRFEHEADVLSAIALGGAEPCIRALQRVGAILQQDIERSSMLHPSEGARVRTLMQFATDPEYRARFALRGLRLRRGILLAIGLSLVAASWSWIAAWPMERALVRYLLGDLPGAREQVERVGTDVPAHQWQWWQDFTAELDAASAIVPGGGEWNDIRDRLAAEGWQRGIATLLRDGPAAARPWFSLAVEAPAAPPLRRAILRYCEAAAANDFERMELLRRHVARLGAPAELSTVFGE